MSSSRANENHSTLVLNSDGTPLSIVPLSVIGFKEAIRLVLSKRVIPLEVYPNWIVHSQKLAISVPSIVMTKKFIKNCWMVRFTKNNIFLRDDYRCQYCGEHFGIEELTLDHVVPKSKGGKRSFTNICSACGPCNWLRGSNDKIKPLEPPKKPTYYELINKRKKYPLNIPSF